MSEQVFLLKHSFRLRHDDSELILHLLLFEQGFLVFLQVQTKLSVRYMGYVAELESELLALLKQHLLTHLFLGQDVFRVTLFMQVGAVVVEARRSFEKEATILS